MKISNFKIECNNLIEIYIKGILNSKFLLKFILFYMKNFNKNKMYLFPDKRYYLL